MPKPRVFISSVMQGFEGYRAAAREAVLRVGAEPVMAEDFEADGRSSRNACLDGVESADAILVLIGERGGWTAPSGKLVVEEEYVEARRLMKPVLVMVQQHVERDESAERLVGKLQDYVDGHFRIGFDSPEDVVGKAEPSLAKIVDVMRLPKVDDERMNELIVAPLYESDETCVKLVVSPERDEKVIDQLEIGTPAFERLLQEIAHSSAVDYFTYADSTETDVETDRVIIRQYPSRRHQSWPPGSALRIDTGGVVEMQAVVRPDGDSMSGGLGTSFAIVRGDLLKRLSAMFAFAGEFYVHRDPYRRHERFQYGVSMLNVGSRRLVAGLDPNQHSWSMDGEIREPLVIEQNEIIARGELTRDSARPARIVALLDRRMKAKRK